MKTPITLKCTVALLAIMGLISFMCTPISYSDRLSEYQKRAREGTGIPAPGYINVSKHRASQIREVKPREQGFLEKAMAYINNKLANRLSDSTTDMVTPHLKQKSSDEVSTTDAAQVIIGAVGGEGDLYKDLDIGSGTDQEYLDADGNSYAEAADDRWLAAEVIDGVRHVYAGFSGYEGSDAIQQAIYRSVVNDVIIVRGGEYDGFILNSEYGDGVTLYGGYRDDGIRDVLGSATTITVNDDSPENWVSGSNDGPNGIAVDALYKATEINGFHIQNNTTNGSAIFANTSYSYPGVTLANNVITGTSGDPWSSSAVGIVINGYSGAWGEVRLEGNTITDMYTAVDIGGDGASAGIYDNTIYDCGNGIEVTDNSSASISNNDISTEGRALNADSDTSLTVNQNNLYSEWEAVSIYTGNIQLWQNNIDGGEGIGVIFSINYSEHTPYIYGNDISGATAAIDVAGYLSGDGNYIDGDIVASYGFGEFSNNSENSSSALGGVDIGIFAPMAERTFQYADDTTLIGQTSDTLLTSGLDYRETMRPGAMIFDVTFGSEDSKMSATKENLGSIFQGLLEDGGIFIQGEDGGAMDPAALAGLIEEVMGEEFTSSGLTGESNQAYMEVAAKLADIITNPTKEQMVVINAMKGMIKEVTKLEGDSGSEEAQKIKDEFTQMVATLLLAQALPDLLQEGEITLVKGLFRELDTERTNILSMYQASTKLYYNGIVKELAANMATLQIKDILSKNMTKDELDKLPTYKIDEILKKIQRIKDKTITDDIILAKEAEYNEKYLKPANQEFERNMTALLSDFSKRILGVLDKAGLVKDGTVKLSKDKT